MTADRVSPVAAVVLTAGVSGSRPRSPSSHPWHPRCDREAELHTIPQLRRSFLGLLIAGLPSLGLLYPATTSAAEAHTGPQNLLLITLETLHADYLGLNAGRVGTPHLDRLAAARSTQ